jgi:hypothetical protein
LQNALAVCKITLLEVGAAQKVREAAGPSAAFYSYRKAIIGSALVAWRDGT